MKVIKSNHCAYQTHYHLVFPVKYRKALLYKEVEEELKQIAKGVGERYEIEFESIGCDKDHIHILCSFHPKYSIGEVIRKFKSITARELFGKFPWLRKELWGGELYGPMGTMPLQLVRKGIGLWLKSILETRGNPHRMNNCASSRYPVACHGEIDSSATSDSSLACALHGTCSPPLPRGAARGNQRLCGPGVSR